MIKPERYMANGFRIHWSYHALSELSDTVKYLEENWTEKELIQFANAVDHTIEIIIPTSRDFSSCQQKKENPESNGRQKQYYILQDSKGLNTNSIHIWNETRFREKEIENRCPTTKFLFGLKGQE